jgi:catechol 2,3-dioxygenase-like lactoylglutathione lyase family enzyme
MSGPPPVNGISELVLEVSDLDAARHFYRDVLGFEETLYGEGAEGRCWYLVGETARLGLASDMGTSSMLVTRPIRRPGLG